MKKKILLPMFASVMALSMNTVTNADEIENKVPEVKEGKTTSAIDLGEYKETTYKVAAIKEGIAVKIREQGSVQNIAYTGDEFKIIATQGDWVEVKVGDGKGWLPARYVDVKEAKGYTTANKVNFRKEANTDAEILEELEIGSSIKVLEQDGDWLKVKKGDDEGYISSLYVSEEAPVIEVEEILVAEVENTNTANTASATTNTATNNTTNNNNNNVNTNNNSTNTNNTSSNNTNSNNNNNNTQPQQPAPEPEPAPAPEQKPEEDNNSYNPPSPGQSSVEAVLNLAYSKIGSPYVWGAEGPNSFDCSGFTSYVFRNAAGVSLPRTSSAQSGYGQTVSKENLQPGDLVFFNTSGKGVSHCGIYVGGGNMIHSPSSGKTVSTTSINSSYYSSRFVTAKRVL
ncbi:MAG: NlpC/P60 family protein [Peptostreptococcaceae bacterium]